GLCSPPHDLVAARECSEVLRAHRKLEQPADRDVELARYRGRCELADARVAIVRTAAYPFVRRPEHSFDVDECTITPQLDRQRLRMAAHRADAHADRL